MSESNITKRAIAAAFKELCTHKAAEKVSVADITRACGLNRQTFYYHFQDKYELMGWIYYTEAIAPVIQDISFENWSSRVLSLLKTMRADRSFYLSTIRQQEESFQDYLFQIVKTLFGDAIHRLDGQNRLSPEDREFYACFYAFGICGTVIGWAKSGMREEPEWVAARLLRLARDTERLAQDTERLAALRGALPQ